MFFIDIEVRYPNTEFISFGAFFIKYLPKPIIVNGRSKSIINIKIQNPIVNLLYYNFRFADLFGSIVSYSRINYKNSHSSANCCGCSLPYEHRAFSGKGGCSLLLRRNSARLFAASAPFVRLCERLQDGRG